MLAEKYAPGRLAKTATVTRMIIRLIIRWAYESELIDTLPQFGPGFKSTSKRAARAAEAQRGGKLFTAEEIRPMLEVARPAMKAMILLAINGGLGNMDVGMLPCSAVDLDFGWVNFLRAKTAVDRRVPLWKQTIIAIRDSLVTRPMPSSSEFTDLVFLTVRRNPWVTIQNDGSRTASIGLEFRKVLRRCSIARRGAGFYSLRHTFQRPHFMTIPAANKVRDETFDSLSRLSRAAAILATLREHN